MATAANSFDVALVAPMSTQLSVCWSKWTPTWPVLRPARSAWTAAYEELVGPKHPTAPPLSEVGSVEYCLAASAIVRDPELILCAISVALLSSGTTTMPTQ